MALNVKNVFYFHIFSFFLVFKRDFIRRAGFTRISASLPVSQLQTQQVMTSQIRSHIEYLIQIYYILVLIL